MSKQFLGVIAAIILVFVGIMMFGSGKSDAPGKSSNSKVLTQHVIGEGKAGVTLIEYGDFQCQFCKDYHLTVKAVKAEYKERIHFQFRNYPLTNKHPNAFAAARAAEAADLQGKFWEMHDVLYDATNWQTWTSSADPTPLFKQYAKQLGLDIAKFEADFGSKKVNDRINADLAEGRRLKVSGTPSFFLDGKKVEIGNDITAFEKVIDEAIAKKAKASTTEPTAQPEPDSTPPTDSMTTEQTPAQ